MPAVRKIGRRLDVRVPQAAALKLGNDAEAVLQDTEGRSSLGEVIRSLRREKGLSQEDLAKKSHVDRTTIARVECGVFKTLSMAKLEGIAAAAGTDLDTLLHKIEAAENPEGPAMFRGDIGRIEFTLDYPEDGFRILSMVPRQKEFFFGNFEIKPQKTVPSAKLPHPVQVYIHTMEGKTLLTRASREFLLKPGDYVIFPGFGEYELYNPDQLRPARLLFITYPSFLLP